MFTNHLEEIWSSIEDILPTAPYGSSLAHLRNKEFLTAIFWLAENNGEWCALPLHYGDRAAIYQRFNRWTRKGLWMDLFSRLQAREDFPFLFDGRQIRGRNSEAKPGLRLTKRYLPRRRATTENPAESR